ncbi:MAG TPA: MFS transporter [Thermoplasmata archaeon]|nr:MFS transporter [Thermoplasmata archaeon]
MQTAAARAIGNLVRAGSDGARETFGYYSKSGKDERRLIGASFFMGAVAAAYWYILILYLDALEFGSVEIGLILGIGSIVGIVSLLFSGVLADRFGRKKLLILGLAGDVIGLALFLSEKNFAIFVLASSVANFSASIISPSLMALLAGKTTTSRVKYLFGLQSFSNQMGMTIAALAGMFLPSLIAVDASTAYWYVIFATVIIGVAPVILTAFTKDERDDGSDAITFRGIVRSFDSRVKKIFVMYSIQNVFIGLGAGILIPWFPLIFKEGMAASDTELAIIFALSNLAIAFGWFIVPKFAEFRGSVILVTVCQFASIAVMMAIPYAPFLALAAVFYVLRNLLMLVPIPVLNAYLMNIVPANIRATFLALTAIAWTIPFAIAESVSGYLWADDYTRVLPFFICCVLYVVATLIFYLYFRNISEPVDAPMSVRDAGKMI